jgi:hypothetical protein
LLLRDQIGPRTGGGANQREGNKNSFHGGAIILPAFVEEKQKT